MEEGVGWTRKQKRDLRERKRGSGFSGLGGRWEEEDGEEEKGEQCGSSEPSKGWRR